MKGLFASVRYLLFLLVGVLAIASLFRHSITHAIDAHPLLPHNLAASPVLHFSPDENLERFDEQQLREAHTSLDISMYSFTDRVLAQVLRQLATERGLPIRIYRDQEQFLNEQLLSRNRGMSTSDMLRGLSSVHIRVKQGSRRALMHLKGYCGDDRWLRDGSANWSPGAEKEQDNSAWVTADPHQVAAYEQKFKEMWDRSSNLVVQ